METNEINHRGKQLLVHLKRHGEIHKFNIVYRVGIGLSLLLAGDNDVYVGRGSNTRNEKGTRSDF